MVAIIENGIAKVIQSHIMALAAETCINRLKIETGLQKDSDGLDSVATRTGILFCVGRVSGI